MNRFETEFGKWVIRWRWWIIAAAIVVALGAASGMRFLTISNDMRVFFSEANPQLQALEALENTYVKNEGAFFIVAPKNGDVFTRETLAAIEELTEAAWQMPYSSRVDSVTNFQHTWAEADDLIVEDLVRDAGSLSAAELDRIRRIALSEPLLVNRLISPTGHVTGINVNTVRPGESMAEIPEITAFARELADRIRDKHTGVDIYLAGAVIMDNAFAEAGQKDMTTLIPAMFFVLVVLVGLALRSFAGTFATLTIILMSMFTGMGLAGWLGINITSASANAPTIILTLAVADSVHILVTIFQHMRKGKSKNDAIAESLRINFMPVFLTSATTAIGFLTMNFSDAPPFRDLGNIVAMGVFAAWAYSIMFLPALMAVLPARVKPTARLRCSSCDRLADFVVGRSNLVFWSTLAVVALLTAGVFRIELNDDWIKYFDKKYDIRQATDFAEEHLTGWNAIEYSLDAGETAGINDPAYLTKVDEFAQWYRQQPGVVHVNVIADTMKRLNMNMHGDDETYYRLPGERDLAAQYLLLYEMSLPFGLDLNNQINVDKSATRMTVRVKDASTASLRQHDTNAREWLKANAPESMFTYGSGLSVIWAHISERNIRSMLGASIGALILISGILMVALRSFKLGLLSLIPNLTPALMAFGVWGMFVGRVGLGLSVIASLTLGIVVDDTVHFLSKYLRARRELGMGPDEAVRYSFNTVGTAMLITTVALVAGFSVLTLSGFGMNSDIGLMTAITITLALAMDFLLLPTLLMKVDGTTEKRAKENEEKNDAEGINDSDGVAVAGTGDGRKCRVA